MSAPAPLRLVVGLGNPGAEYAATRHNIGFWMVDQLAALLKVALSPQSRFFGLAGRSNDRGGEVWLLQPTTFMNRSGHAVSALARFYKINPEEILVIHDELDLLPGEIRIKQGGGHAGHNGLKDIAAQLGTPNFWRLRLGVGHPRTLGLNQGVADFVLHPPRLDEMPALELALERCRKAWPKLAAGDFVAAQRELHGKAGLVAPAAAAGK